MPQTVLDPNNVLDVANFKSSMITQSPTPATPAPYSLSAQALALGKQLNYLTGGGENASVNLAKGETSHIAGSGTTAVRSGGSGSGDVAPIVWTNRGVTSGTNNDRFNDVFGVNANIARAVMDAAINMWARTIGAFNYGGGFAGSTYQLTVKMATGASGNGASAGVSSWAGSKPLSGGITMGSGGDGFGSGWFIDPTPYDNSEYMGTIDNAFAAEAQSGSPGLGKGDFLTVALAEMAHCMGLFTAPSGLQSFVTNTGVNDAAGGASGAKLFVENSANINHLMTAFNSGSPQNFNAAIHTAEPQSLTFGGTGYNGTDDAGNAYYSFSQRCLVPENLRLIFHDTLGYSTVSPANFETMYASLDSSGILQVRGGPGTSSDVIAISVSGSNMIVDVDVSADVAGSGSLPGAGNLGSWRTIVPLGSISYVSIQGGDGNDYLRMEGNGGKTVYEDGGAGDDYFDFDFYSRNLSNSPSGSINVYGGTGAGDHVWVYDDGLSTAQTYTITSARFDRPGWAGFFYDAALEGLTLTTTTAADTVNIPSTYTGQPIDVHSAGGGDVVNVGDNAAGIGLQNINAAVYVYNNPSFTTLNLLEGSDTVARTGTMGFTTDGGGAPLGYLSGVAPASIYWDRNDISSINLTMGSAADMLRVYDNSETLNIHNTGSGDTVRIGDDTFFISFPFLIFGDGLDGMTGNITIDNAPSFTTIEVTDLYGSVARNATWSVASGFTNIAGLMPAGTISYKNADVSSVRVDGGAQADSFTINDFYRNTTINSGGGNDTVTLNGNSVGWTLTLDMGAADDTVNIVETSTPVYLTTGAGSAEPVNVNADGVGTASVIFSASDEIGVLSLGAGGVVTLLAGHDKMLSVSGANITGRVDVNDNAYLRRGAADETFYRTRLINGRNGGLWNGAQPSFMSTFVGASALADSLGYAFAGTGTALTTLYGLPIAAGDLLIKYALNGDLNLDGTVNFDDLLVMAQNYTGTGKGWSQGDINYDGSVTFDDLLALAQQYGNSAIAIVNSMVAANSARTRRIPSGTTADSVLT